MNDNIYIPFSDRAVIAIEGKDAESFLQSLISNDISKASDKNAIYALLLTPQGKYLYDFFIAQQNTRYLLDVSTAHKDTIIKRLSMYKLRSDVEIIDLSNTYEIVALLGERVFDEVDGDRPGTILNFCKGLAYIDPRSDILYARSIIEKENKYNAFIVHDFELGERAVYDDLRIENMIPSGTDDLVSGEDFPLDFGLDQFNAVDYKKGCYVGQEVTARVHHKGTLRKKIKHITTNTFFPEHGSTLTQNGKKIGAMLSSIDKLGLCLVNNDAAGDCEGGLHIVDSAIAL